MFVANFIIHAKAANKSPARALEMAAERLLTAAAQVKRGEYPGDPGVDFRKLDPGGGPCAPLRPMDFDVSTSGLPEAISRDD